MNEKQELTQLNNLIVGVDRNVKSILKKLRKDMNYDARLLLNILSRVDKLNIRGLDILINRFFNITNQKDAIGAIDGKIFSKILRIHKKLIISKFTKNYDIELKKLLTISEILLKLNHRQDYILKNYLRILEIIKDYDYKIKKYKILAKYGIKSNQIDFDKARILLNQKKFKDVRYILHSFRKKKLIKKEKQNLFRLKIGFLYQSKRYKEALKLINKNINKDKKLLISYLNLKGLILLNQHLYAESIGLWKSLLKKELLSEFKYFYILSYSFANFKLKKYNEVINTLKKLILIRRIDQRIKFGAISLIIRSYMELKNYKDALISIDKYILNIKKFDIKLFKGMLLQRAICLRELGKIKESVKIFNRLLNKDQKNDTIIKNKGISYYNLKKYDIAKNLLNKTLKLKPKDREAIRYIGNIYKRQNNYKLALKYYDKCLKIYPKDIKAIRNKAIISLNSKDYKEAEKLVKQALGINPNDLDSLNLLSSIYFEWGKYKESIKINKKIIAKNPKDADTIGSIGGAYSNLGRYERGIVYLRKALKINPKHPYVLLNTGITLGKLGKLNESVKYLRLANKIKPNDNIFLQNLMISLIKLKRHKEIIKTSDAILKLNPNDSIAWKNRGIALLNLKKYKEALTCFSRANKIRPNDISILHRVQYIFFQLGQYKKSIYYNKKILIKNPKDADTIGSIGGAYSNLGQYERGLYYLNKALSFNTKHKIVLESKILTLYKMRRYEEALRVLDSLDKLDSKNVQFIENFRDRIKRKLMKDE